MPETTIRYAVEGWGVGELALRDGRVLGHWFDFAPSTAAVVDAAPRRLSAPERDARRQATELIERVRASLAGAAVGFDDVVLELGECTPFQRALTDVLRAVPRGEVVTYGELAALAGRPGAQRAAGTFCASNRFWLLVPCHRVVAADGIGGYGSAGADVKRRLLALEGVRL